MPKCVDNYVASYIQFSSIDAYPRALLYRLDDGPVIVEKK